jgi:tRNA A37 threonylcarbamoyladenosine modification protein TsaB
MKYLYIDASDFKTYAQVGDGHFFKHEIFDTNRDFAAQITNICDAMLERGGFGMDEIEIWGLGLGPGSLTGLRVAGSFMRTLAMLTGAELVGVNRFTWALKGLAMAGVTGRVRLLAPTLINKAFSLYGHLPNLDYTEPCLVTKSELAPEPEVQSYGIDFATDFVSPIEFSPSTLHQLILHDNASVKRAKDFNALLEVLPLYIIPSQAERKLGIEVGA